MTEHIEIGEQEISAFGFWIDSLSEGEVRDLDPVLARGVLEHFGADFEHTTEAITPLAEFSNKAKRAGLDVVWGSEVVDSFWKFINGSVAEIEANRGSELPRLGKKPKEGPDNRPKFSGMRAFVGELTALAAGQMTPEEYKRYTADRIVNGISWKEGVRGKGTKVRTETHAKDAPMVTSSVPPEFPRMLLDYLKSHSSSQT